ncbi:MAG: TonB-dependent receptor [Bacteroidales bacterium]|nr:TonB-dependent receptor [Bacteroidales bacterium]
MLISTYVSAQNDTIVEREVVEIVVKGERKRNISVNSEGRIILSPQQMNNTMKVLGEADPLKFVLMLPGAGTSSDYASGISVQGSDYSQTYIGLAGAPLFFPYHLFGIFSVCNSTHFSDVIFEKSIHNADFDNRIGGLIELKPRDQKLRHLTGDFNVGMLASSFTLGIPCSKRLSVYTSARVSYIPLFYSSLLKSGEGETSYDFQDANLTAVYRFNFYNKLVLNAFFDNDDFGLHEYGSVALNLGWQNLVSSLSWQHEGNTNLDVCVFYSGFHSNLDLSMANNNIDVPSMIYTAGVRINATRQLIPDKSQLKYGTILSMYGIQPQGVDSDFGGKINPDTKSLEHNFYAQADYRLSDYANIVFGVRYSGFAAEQKYYKGLSPLITLNVNAAGCEFSAHYSIYRQFLHQIGFSDVGLSTNSWIEVSKKLPPQTSSSATLSCLRKIGDGNTSIQAEAYYKKVANQSEFFGNIFDLFSNDYLAENYIETGNGYNTGVDLLITKSDGKIYGSAGYTFGLSRRKFSKFYEGYMPSSNESMHTVKINVNYKAGRKWLLSMLFNYSSGRPVTPIKYVYMIGEKIIAEYGRHNSGRLDDYHRLDLSASYRFQSKRQGRLFSTINLTLMNVYGKENTELRYYKFDMETNKINYREKNSIFRFMPSMSYSLHF